MIPAIILGVQCGRGFRAPEICSRYQQMHPAFAAVLGNLRDSFLVGIEATRSIEAEEDYSSDAGRE